MSVTRVFLLLFLQWCTIIVVSRSSGFHSYVYALHWVPATKRGARWLES